MSGQNEPLDPWEARWAPYDDDVYEAVLAALCPEDVVLEIGAGDLRLARRMAERVRRVVAWELQEPLVQKSRAASLPANLKLVCTDARDEAVPTGVTTAVLLMRHCTHFAQYVRALRAAGCRRLITNARWGMGVEVMSLDTGVPFAQIEPGWYACRRCGAVGLAATDPARIDSAAIERVTDVEGCPTCSPKP